MAAAGPEAAAIRSTCPYCGVGCGVLLRPDGRGGLAVAGDPDHPANRGRLCQKGLALGETLSTGDRLAAPLVGGAETGWDAALDLVAGRLAETVERHGPDSVAFYVSGQLLTEDYYAANKLMKGFIGSANIDTNSRLCMASTVAGHRRAFGTDTVPGTYEDLDEADLVVLVGSNLAWCHPVLYGRLAAARAARGTRVVVVDPRRTASCDIAEMHLAIRPGSDVALFNGLLAHLHEVGALDAAFLRDHVAGFDDALRAAMADDAGATGLPATTLAGFYRLFAATPRTVTVFSQGVNQSDHGTDKVNAILNCHLATGRIGRPGAGPFSVTGQPNAMGGREVGGLATTLAAHLDLEAPAHRDAVRRFWDAPRLAERPGLRAVEMFRAAAEGRIKALWIACTNPAVSMPEADAVAAAIAGCDFTVVSDVTMTDTARLAHVVLPAAAWAEKDGTVTNSDRTISRQRAALPPHGAARPDWAIFAEVGRRMGWARAFDWRGPAEIFREHAALSGLAGRLGRDFDISGLAGLPDGAYAAMAPVRWPVAGGRTGGRFFGAGGFFTADGRGRMVAVRQPRAEAAALRLNTGRVRDQWHTMTRTAKAPRLSAHLAEPFVAVHPDDARRLGLEPAGLARLAAGGAEALLRVLVSEDVAPGQPFAPMHWSGRHASAGRVNPVVHALCDPHSGQPDLKGSAVAIRPWRAAWHAFAVSAGPVAPACEYWARMPCAGGWRVEMAGAAPVADWAAEAARLFGRAGPAQAAQDARGGRARLAWTDGEGRLVAALFAAPGPVEAARDWLAARLGRAVDDPLAARPGAGRADPDPVVCTCLGVGRAAIRAAIARGAADVAAVGAACGAGTGCGACRPEIGELLARAAPPAGGRIAAE